MSAVKLFDKNTIFEPICVCACGKKFKVDQRNMIEYSIESINGQIYLCLDGNNFIPLLELKD